MEMTISKAGKSKKVKCKECGSTNLTLEEGKSRPVMGAKFLEVKVICENKHVSFYRWTQPVELRNK